MESRNIFHTFYIRTLKKFSETQNPLTCLTFSIGLKEINVQFPLLSINCSIVIISGACFTQNVYTITTFSFTSVLKHWGLTWVNKWSTYLYCIMQCLNIDQTLFELPLVLYFVFLFFFLRNFKNRSTHRHDHRILSLLLLSWKNSGNVHNH